jgi:hypothetical protein
MEGCCQLHTPATLFTKKEPFDASCIVGWVGPTPGLNMLERRKISLLGIVASFSNPRLVITMTELLRVSLFILGKCEVQRQCLSKHDAMRDYGGVGV